MRTQQLTELVTQCRRAFLVTESADRRAEILAFMQKLLAAAQEPQQAQAQDACSCDSSDSPDYLPER